MAPGPANWFKTYAPGLFLVGGVMIWVACANLLGPTLGTKLEFYGFGIGILWIAQCQFLQLRKRIAELEAKGSNPISAKGGQ